MRAHEPSDAGMRRLLVAVVALILGSLAACGVELARGSNVHQPGASCTMCHTQDADALRKAGAAARLLLRPDLEASCNACHGREGPSHRTGMAIHPGTPHAPPNGAAAAGPLLLPRDGKVQCYTCHFMHGENNRFGSFLRVDNHRGGLCLSCHTMGELQP